MSTYQAVHWLNEPNDLRVAVLGQLGFSVDTIAAQTGYTRSQVLHRLKKAEIKVGDYRRGQSQIARAVIGRAKDAAASKWRATLEVRARAKFVELGWGSNGHPRPR